MKDSEGKVIFTNPLRSNQFPFRSQRRLRTAEDKRISRISIRISLIYFNIMFLTYIAINETAESKILHIHPVNDMETFMEKCRNKMSALQIQYRMNEK